MQQAHEAGLAVPRQHIADLPDDAPFRVGARPVHRKAREQSVMVINRGNQVGTGEQVIGFEIVEDRLRFHDLGGYPRLDLRRGNHVQGWRRSPAPMTICRMRQAGSHHHAHRQSHHGSRNRHAFRSRARAGFLPGCRRHRSRLRLDQWSKRATFRCIHLIAFSAGTTWAGGGGASCAKIKVPPGRTYDRRRNRESKSGGRR